MPDATAKKKPSRIQRATGGNPGRRAGCVFQATGFGVPTLDQIATEGRGLSKPKYIVLLSSGKEEIHTTYQHAYGNMAGPSGRARRPVTAAHELFGYVAAPKLDMARDFAPREPGCLLVKFYTRCAAIMASIAKAILSRFFE